MKIKLIQDSAIFISALTAEQFKKVKKFIPEALTLNRVEDNKKIPVCMISYADCGGVNDNGIVFDSTTDSGNLCVTLQGCEGLDNHISTEEKAKLVSERYSGLILKVNELEAQIVESLAVKEAEINAAQSSIETVALD